MKVSEIKYERYTIEQAKAGFEEFKAALADAKCEKCVMRARDKFIKEVYIEYATAASLSNCRFTLNTKDEFYQGEMAYYDEVSPLFAQMMTEYADLMLESPYRAGLEKLLNPRIFDLYEVSKKSFGDAIVEDMQNENAICTEYSKFMSELLIDFDGEKLPLSVVRGKLSDTDRAVRRAAAEAIGRGLEG